MSKTDDGGPAFPGAAPMVAMDQSGHLRRVEDGMSLRDWFASMALQGIIACPEPAPDADNIEELTLILANAAYTYADAMIAARKAGDKQ
jgi:hypothetical protein